jgi:phospholipase C
MDHDYTPEQQAFDGGLTDRDCSSSDGGLGAVSGRNVGDVLNAKDIAWGWFQGGFRPTEIKDGKAVCGAKSTNLAGSVVADYSPHHEPF